MARFNVRAIVILVVLVILGIYLVSGVYQVGPSEVGLVKLFGKYVRTAGPGIHYHLPYPFETVTKTDVRTLRKIEIGFRTISTNPLTYREIPEESLMLTGDGNIASVEAVVRYRVKDPVKFAFKLVDDFTLVKFVTESVIREKVAGRTIDEVLTTERDVIAMEAARKIQRILDEMDVGISIEGVYLQDVSPPEKVADAFYDVINALQDKERIINDAQKYANDVIPRAEGEAQKILNEAEAYMQEKILEAQGETARFLQVLRKYRENPEITRERLYIETLERVLADKKKILILTKDGTLKLLDLGKLIAGEGGEGK